MNFIPVIDFGSCGLNANNDTFSRNAFEVGESLYNAFNVYGFAYLSNSGITDEEVKVVNNVTEKFFQASNEEKLKFVKGLGNYGYSGPINRQVDPAKPSDYTEAFNFLGSYLDDPDTYWPNALSPQSKNILKNFMEKCRLLSLRILKVVGIGMKLADTDHFVKNHSLMNKSGNGTALRSLYYPPLPKEQQMNKLRFREHTDFGSLTLLFQDSVGGLQVQNFIGEYIDAIAIDGTVLINIGDMLQFWSQNLLKSTKHRVVNSQDPEKQNLIRRSLAFFVHPDENVLVDEELIFENKKILNEKEKLNKSGVTAHDYLKTKLKENYGDSQSI